MAQPFSFSSIEDQLQKARDEEASRLQNDLVTQGQARAGAQGPSGLLDARGENENGIIWSRATGFLGAVVGSVGDTLGGVDAMIRSLPDSSREDSIIGPDGKFNPTAKSIIGAINPAARGVGVIGNAILDISVDQNGDSWLKQLGNGISKRATDWRAKNTDAAALRGSQKASDIIAKYDKGEIGKIDVALDLVGGYITDGDMRSSLGQMAAESTGFLAGLVLQAYATGGGSLATGVAGKAAQVTAASAARGAASLAMTSTAGRVLSSGVGRLALMSGLAGAGQGVQQTDQIVDLLGDDLAKAPAFVQAWTAEQQLRGRQIEFDEMRKIYRERVGLYAGTLSGMAGAVGTLVAPYTEGTALRMMGMSATGLLGGATLGATTRLGAIARAAGAEAGVETVQTFVDAAAPRLALGASPVTGDVLHATIQGALLGGIMGGATNVGGRHVTSGIEAAKAARAARAMSAPPTGVSAKEYQAGLAQLRLMGISEVDAKEMLQKAADLRARGTPPVDATASASADTTGPSPLDHMKATTAERAITRSAAQDAYTQNQAVAQKEIGAFRAETDLKTFIETNGETIVPPKQESAPAPAPDLTSPTPAPTSTADTTSSVPAPLPPPPAPKADPYAYAQTLKEKAATVEGPAKAELLAQAAAYEPQPLTEEQLASAQSFVNVMKVKAVQSEGAAKAEIEAKIVQVQAAIDKELEFANVMTTPTPDARASMEDALGTGFDLAHGLKRLTLVDTFKELGFEISPTARFDRDSAHHVAPPDLSSEVIMSDPEGVSVAVRNTDQPDIFLKTKGTDWRPFADLTSEERDAAQAAIITATLNPPGVESDAFLEEFQQIPVGAYASIAQRQAEADIVASLAGDKLTRRADSVAALSAQHELTTQGQGREPDYSERWALSSQNNPAIVLFDPPDDAKYSQRVYKDYLSTAKDRLTALASRYAPSFASQKAFVDAFRPSEGAMTPEYQRLSRAATDNDSSFETRRKALATAAKSSRASAEYRQTAQNALAAFDDYVRAQQLVQAVEAVQRHAIIKPHGVARVTETLVASRSFLDERGVKLQNPIDGPVTVPAGMAPEVVVDNLQTVLHLADVYGAPSMGGNLYTAAEQYGTIVGARSELASEVARTETVRAASARRIAHNNAADDTASLDDNVRVLAAIADAAALRQNGVTVAEAEIKLKMLAMYSREDRAIALKRAYSQTPEEGLQRLIDAVKFRSSVLETTASRAETPVTTDGEASPSPAPDARPSLTAPVTGGRVNPPDAPPPPTGGSPVLAAEATSPQPGARGVPPAPQAMPAPSTLTAAPPAVTEQPASPVSDVFRPSLADTKPATPMAAEQVAAHIKDRVAALAKNGIEVKVFPTLDAFRGWRATQGFSQGAYPALARALWLANTDPNPRTHGTVAVIADNLGSTAEVDAAMDHEIIGHFGIPYLIGEREYRAIQRDILNAPQSGDASLKSLYSSVVGKLAREMAKMPENADVPKDGLQKRLVAMYPDWIASEVIAEAASSSAAAINQHALVQRVGTALREAGLGSYSLADIQRIAKSANIAVTTPAAAVQRAELAALASPPPLVREGGIVRSRVRQAMMDALSDEQALSEAEKGYGSILGDKVKNAFWRLRRTVETASSQSIRRMGEIEPAVKKLAGTIDDMFKASKYSSREQFDADLSAFLKTRHAQEIADNLILLTGEVSTKELLDARNDYAFEISDLANGHNTEEIRAIAGTRIEQLRDIARAGNDKILEMMHDDRVVAAVTGYSRAQIDSTQTLLGPIFNKLIEDSRSGGTGFEETLKELTDFADRQFRESGLIGAVEEGHYAAYNFKYAVPAEGIGRHENLMASALRDRTVSDVKPEDAETKLKARVSAFNTARMSNAAFVYRYGIGENTNYKNEIPRVIGTNTEPVLQTLTRMVQNAADAAVDQDIAAKLNTALYHVRTTAKETGANIDVDKLVSIKEFETAKEALQFVENQKGQVPAMIYRDPTGPFHLLQVHDKGLWRALHSRHDITVRGGMIGRAMSIPTRVQSRLLVGLNPIFTISRQLVRDLQSAMSIAGLEQDLGVAGAAGVAQNTMRNMYRLTSFYYADGPKRSEILQGYAKKPDGSWEKEFYDFVEHGGDQQFAQLFADATDRGLIAPAAGGSLGARAVAKVRTGIELYERFPNHIDNMVRFSLYQTLAPHYKAQQAAGKLVSGYSGPKAAESYAAEMARSLMPFTQRSAVGRALSPFFAFSQTALTGVDQAVNKRIWKGGQAPIIGVPLPDGRIRVTLAPNWKSQLNMKLAAFYVVKGAMSTALTLGLAGAMGVEDDDNGVAVQDGIKIRDLMNGTILPIGVSAGPLGETMPAYIAEPIGFTNVLHAVGAGAVAMMMGYDKGAVAAAGANVTLKALSPLNASVDENTTLVGGMFEAMLPTLLATTRAAVDDRNPLTDMTIGMVAPGGSIQATTPGLSTSPSLVQAAREIESLTGVSPDPGMINFLAGQAGFLGQIFKGALEMSDQMQRGHMEVVPNLVRNSGFFNPSPVYQPKSGYHRMMEEHVKPIREEFRVRMKQDAADDPKKYGAPPPGVELGPDGLISLPNFSARSRNRMGPRAREFYDSLSSDQLEAIKIAGAVRQRVGQLKATADALNSAGQMTHDRRSELLQQEHIAYDNAYAKLRAAFYGSKPQAELMAR